MGSGFRFVWVIPLVAACGGTEIDAARHVDGEPRVGDAALPPMVAASDGGIVAPVGEAGAPLADAGARTLTCRTLSPDPLSGSTFSNPDVTGIDFPSDSTTADGIASWDDKKSLWKAAIGPDGLVSTSDLLTDVNVHADGFVYIPRGVTVRSVPAVGDVLGLSGVPPPSYSQFTHLWFARAASPDSEWFRADSLVPGDPAAVLEDFALSADGQSYVYLTGSLDAYGNLVATQANGRSNLAGQDVSISFAYSLALQQLSDQLEVSYRTDVRDWNNELSPTNPRISDHLDQIDFVHETTKWTVPLAMRRLAQLRVNSTEDTFVVGVLQDGDVFDVRKISSTGVTDWAVAPPSFGYPVDSIVADVAPDGGIVVGLNLGIAPGGPGGVALERFSRDGTSCTVRRLPGGATDVAVLADGFILLAADDAIPHFAP